MSLKTLRLGIRGRVQGVGYRFFAVKEATKLDITGFVRNMERGDEVEVLACGGEAEVSRFIDRLRQGPTDAEVTDVSAQPGRPDTTYPDFTIRY